MGNIGDELPPLLLRFLKGVRHGVEGFDELADLVLPAGVVDPGVEVALGELPGGGGHVPDGLGLLHGGGGRGHEGDEQHRHGGHAENPQESPPHFRHSVGLRDRQDGADGHRPLGAGRDGHHRPGLFIEAQGGYARIHLPLGQLPAQGQGEGDLLVIQLGADAQEFAPLGNPDEEVRAAHLLGYAHHGAQVLLLGQPAAGFDVGVQGHLGDDLRPVPEFAALFRHNIAVGQGKKGRPQQDQRQRHHAYGDGEGPPVDALKSFHL